QTPQPRCRSAIARRVGRATCLTLGAGHLVDDALVLTPLTRGGIILTSGTCGRDRHARLVPGREEGNPTMSFERARYLALVLGVALLAGFATLATGQVRKNPNEVYVEPGVNVEDAFIKKTGDFWVLDFKFKSPRLITVNIPGKGERIVWYMWYQVINYSSEPRTFVPDFE